MNMSFKGFRPIICVRAVRDRRRLRPDAGGEPGRGKEDWIVMFNGKDLTGWTPKSPSTTLATIFGTPSRRGRPAQGAFTTRQNFDGQFGHLFYKEPFSYYRWVVDTASIGSRRRESAWDLRTARHAAFARSAHHAARQTFPISIEGQLLGGNSDGKPRPPPTCCSPGTEIVYQHKLYKDMPEFELAHLRRRTMGARGIRGARSGTSPIRQRPAGARVRDAAVWRGVVDNFNTPPARRHAHR